LREQRYAPRSKSSFVSTGLLPHVDRDGPRNPWSPLGPGCSQIGSAAAYGSDAMGIDVVSVTDRAVGNAIEGMTNAHHARRLGRLGRGAQRTPPDDGQLWAAGDPPPRAGNAVDVLIDGVAYFSALERAIRGARRSVLLAGWCITPHFALVRTEPPVLLRELLREAAELVEVRVLLWAGAPVPLFAPRRSSVREAREQLVRGTRIKAALDSHERPMHCHHEKVVVIDDEVAFVGGIDLTDLGGDRYDTPARPARGRLGWHDVACRLRGPAVADVARHVAQRWEAVTGERVAVEPTGDGARAGDVEVQIVRTVPEKLYGFAPRGDFRILEAYVRALRSAQHLIYLENQFLWSPEVVDLLTDKLRRPPSDDFRVVVMLPARPNNGADDTRGQLSLLTDADADQQRFLATTIRARSGDTTDPAYVHAKVGIVDDRWLTLGSANLNAHSFFNDSEVNVVTCDPALARDTRLRLWAAHLERDIDEVAGDSSLVVDGLWRPTATEQRERRHRGERLTHGLVELQGVSRRSERLLGPLQALLVDG
jgi:phosphatidylserine/phosphatidylglycerophosphate/cardiolipin synthase-like enzyme